MRGLNWSDERYARIYSRDTMDWLLLSWRARGLYALLRRAADRSGIIRLGRAGRRGVAALVNAVNEADEVLAALGELERDGWIELGDAGSGSGPCIVIPEFIESEEARTSDAARQRVRRERVRDKARANVIASTDSHETGQDRHASGHTRASHPAVTHPVTPERHGGASHPWSLRTFRAFRR